MIYMAVPTKVILIMGRAGVKGVSRVRCKVTSDSGRDKVLVRNVLGPVRLGDILMVPEAEMETATMIE